MKKIILILIFFEIAFGKININDADRYELMTIGKLDAGRADMLINYRKNKEITDKNQLKLITGFGGYDTSVLEENFDIKEKEK
ncbi:MAG: helix-hairpin-helix domain-containing protein, partial [Campylobacter sp.]|nr:helix-hairpin-helix domain-containing protein [Campylobacter sp.]